MATIVLRNVKGSPLTFTELDANFTNINTDKIERNGSIDFTGAQSFTAGTAAAPSIRFVGFTTTGWSAPAGAPTLSVAGTAAITVATNRTVTISAPTAGTALTVNSLTNSNVINTTDGTTSFAIYLNGSLGTILNQSSNHPLRFYTNNIERGSIAAAGNVTINAPSSGQTLSVTGANTFTGAAGLVQILATDGTVNQAVGYANSTIAYAGTTSNHAYALITNNGVRVNIASGGNVSINAPTAGAALTVTGTSPEPAAILGNVRLGANVGFINPGANIWSQSGSAMALGTVDAFTLGLWTNSVQRIAINSAGNVTVNAPSSGAPLTIAANNIGLDITAVTSLASRIRIASNGNTLGTNSFDMGQGFASASDNIAWLLNRANAGILFGTNNLQRMDISAGGNVTINAAASGVSLTVAAVSGQYGINVTSGLGGQAVNWVATSDRRIKSEIADVSTADAIKAVRMIHAKSYVKAGQRDLGLIAQDVQELPGVFKDAVKQAEGNDMLALNYDGLTVAMLLPVVQHLLNEVDVLKARVR